MKLSSGWSFSRDSGNWSQGDSRGWSFHQDPMRKQNAWCISDINGFLNMVDLDWEINKHRTSREVVKRPVPRALSASFSESVPPEAEIILSCNTGHDKFQKHLFITGCMIESPTFSARNGGRFIRKCLSLCQRKEAVLQPNFQWQWNSKPLKQILYLLDELKL